ncbi:hypothetical protein K502DRAFT_326406 [Neoconidiobolus thromboides FSU 785]|nr:hypothetical protein K502DRAFT_326406 [Neoconidiobolus thromboides FSU 785]
MALNKKQGVINFCIIISMLILLLRGEDVQSGLTSPEKIQGCYTLDSSICPGYSEYKFPAIDLFSNYKIDDSQSLKLYFEYYVGSSFYILDIAKNLGCSGFTLSSTDVKSISFWDVFFQHINDPNQCPNQEATKSLLSQQLKCVEVNNSACITKEDNEPKTCGFNLSYQKEELCNLCKKSSPDDCCTKVDIDNYCVKKEELKPTPEVPRLTTKDPIFVSSIVIFGLSLIIGIISAILFFKARLAYKNPLLNGKNFKMDKQSIEESISRSMKSTSSLKKLEKKDIENILQTSEHHILEDQDSFNTSQTPLVLLNSSDSSEMESFVVSTNYVPVLPDEISLEKGDMVEVRHRFDDGWALGRNLSTDKTGAFPLACLYPANVPTINKNHLGIFESRSKNGISRRTSSQRTSRFLN